MTSDETLLNKYPAATVIPLVLLVDQTLKYLIDRAGIQISCNRGVAFGIGRDVTLITVVVLILVLGLLVSQKQNYTRLALALIFGGGFSNLIDRIVFGCVRDFVKIGVFPAFNLADVAITVGVFIIVYSIFAKNSVRGLDT